MIIIPLIILTTGALTLAEERDPMRMRGEEIRGRLAERLKLTDEQRKKLESLRVEHQKQQIAHRAKVQTATLELRQLMRADTPDKAAIERKMNEIAKLRVDGNMRRFNHLQSMRELLTPEQQQALRELRSEVRPKMRKFMRERMERRLEGGEGRPFGRWRHRW
jgi:Spy/CpxP family protein refolding chaperone